MARTTKPNASKGTAGNPRSRKRAESPAQKSAKRGGAPQRVQDDRILDESTRRNMVAVVFVIAAIVLFVAALLPTSCRCSCSPAG